MMNPIMFEISGYQMHWYSFLIMAGVALGYILFYREAKKKNINTYFISNLFFWLIVFGIIGARAYYVFFNWEYYGEHLGEIVQLWNGGLAIHGGVLFGIIFLIIYCIKYKVRFLRITDFGVVALAAAQAVGRWGNFFNSEAYGPETTKETLESLFIPEYIINGMYINGVYYHPTFFYESLWMLIGFILLLIIRRLKYTKIGELTGIYMMWYGVGRGFIEILRQDSLMLGDFKVAQLVSVILFVLGIIIYALSKKGSKFENLYGEKDEEFIKF